MHPTNRGSDTKILKLAAAPVHILLTDAEPSPRSDETEQRARDARRKKKRQKDKVRSVWISFVGRILAQFVGSTASIVLGLLLARQYQKPSERPRQIATEQTEAAPSMHTNPVANSAVAGRRSLTVRPLEDFSPAAPKDGFAQSLTAVLTARLAERTSLSVSWRAAAARGESRGRNESAPAVEPGPDLIVTGSVVRTSTRIRITAELIDGRRGALLWARIYERSAGDVIAIQDEVADEIAKALDGVLAPGTAGAVDSRLTARNEHPAPTVVDTGGRISLPDPDHAHAEPGDERR